MSERNLDFDAIINRRGRKCLKYDFAVKRGYPKDVLPLWVADMDFKTSSYIEDALADVVSHNIYGYTNIQKGDGFFEAVARWMKKYHDWKVLPEWHVVTPGVCFAIASAIRAYTKVGESVIIQQPVYYPFSNIIIQNDRKLISNDLVYDKEGHYSIDFDDFEKKIQENDVKLFVLCNPHNPVGRVWTREELERLGEICKKYNVVVFSDEIHFDFIWKGKHQIFQKVRSDFKEFTITATAPTKTFNLAGLQQSNIFIPNKELRDKFIFEYDVSGMDEPNIFGIAAAEAAYNYGDEWYEASNKYIKENIDFASRYIEEKLPGVRLVPTEGTYLIWLDFRGTGLSHSVVDDLIINKAKLWLDSGKIFGKTGEGFQRINVACPRSVLAEALERIRDCISDCR
ncbi:MAG: pyridoxal phosphate-dependent aminotransferase [Lachnospiraceae bacterium]|nr:pyridoxal phosphate-dependent aminotransferase [Lachnospiraceae bacterium]